MHALLAPVAVLWSSLDIMSLHTAFGSWVRTLHSATVVCLSSNLDLNTVCPSVHCVICRCPWRMIIGPSLSVSSSETCTSLSFHPSSSRRLLPANLGGIVRRHLGPDYFVYLRLSRSCFGQCINSIIVHNSIMSIYMRH